MKAAELEKALAESDKKDRGVGEKTPKKKVKKPTVKTSTEPRKTNTRNKKSDKPVSRYVEIDENIKRNTTGYHIHPAYEKAIEQIYRFKKHRKIGGTVEFLTDFFLSNISEKDRKEILEIDTNSDY